MPRMTKKIQDAAREAAILAVQYYKATLAMHDDAPVVKYDKKHLDDTLDDTPGYLVQAWVFIAHDEITDEDK